MAFNLELDIKTDAEQTTNQIKQPTADPEHEPFKIRTNEKKCEIND